jgi:MFS family permease
MTPSPAPASPRHAVFAATLGNGLEFYDFVTFAYFAIQIGKTFFPTHDPFVSLMASLATFGAGFITRPLGAWLIGGHADRIGRKRAMTLSMLLMGLGIGLLVLTPGYDRIGIAAPILAVIARLIQGFALGGEVGSATSYMAEAADSRHRGLTIAWQSSSQNISASAGALIGLAVTLSTTPAQLTAFGWRIALALGLLIVPLALIVRRSLPETLHTPEPEPIPTSGQGRVIWLGATIIAVGTTATYVFHYMTTFGQATLHLSTSVSMAGELANHLIGIVTPLFGGWLSDRIGRKPMMIVPHILFTLAIVPSFAWLSESRSAVAFIGGNLILGGLFGCQFAVVLAAIAEGLPKLGRARLFALVYSIPVAVFGGTTQLVVTWLLKVAGTPMAVAWYLVAISLIGLAAMAAMRESAPVRKSLPLQPALA